MSFSAGRVKKPSGQNIGNSKRGSIWSPKYRMRQRRVNRVLSAGSKINQPKANIETRVGGKPGEGKGRHA